MMQARKIGVGVAVLLAQAGLCVGPLVSTLAAQPPAAQQDAAKTALPAVTPQSGAQRPAVDRETSPAKLLPPAPEALPVGHPWLVDDLAQVPEVLFQKREAGVKRSQPEPKTFAERDAAAERELRERQMAIEKTTKLMAKINRINSEGTDRFMTLMRDSRPDLAGMPFLLGSTCRLSTERGKAFVTAVAMARHSMPREPQANEPARDPANQAKRFWVGYTARHVWGHAPTRDKADAEWTATRVAALMQVLGPEDKAFRTGLVKHLSETQAPAATQALGRLAVFSFEKDVRQAAIAALKGRPSDDTTDVLLAGMRFPWPAVAQHAGEATVQLGRKDLVPRLVALLDAPDPRAPAEIAINGKQTLAVREVVRLNHQRSCLLCHPPANLPAHEIDGQGASPNVVTAPVPTSEEPPRTPFFGYDPSGSPPEIFVRADATYLRQEFSLMQPVEVGGASPRMQRFDFVVRTRPVPPAAKAEYQQWRQQQGRDYLAPHQRAAIAALRGLTGRNADEPTARAWSAALAK